MIGGNISIIVLRFYIQVATMKLNKKGGNTMKKWLHFKTIFRLGVVFYWASALFINHWLLIALLPFAIIRTVEFGGYNEWKMIGYGKNDKQFTLRKLLYFIKKAEELNTKNAIKYKNYNGNFCEGYISIDGYVKIKLQISDFKHKAELLFKGQTIATYSGFSFQRIKWDLEDTPEFKRIVAKFLQHIEEDLEQTDKEQKRTKQKEETKEEMQQKEKRKELLKEARQLYKKEMEL